MRTIVASTITVALVARNAESDGDVTERGDLRRGTPNQLSHVYKAGRLNVGQLSQDAKESLQHPCSRPCVFFCFRLRPEHHYQCFGCYDDGIGSLRPATTCEDEHRFYCVVAMGFAAASWCASRTCLL